MQDDYEVGDYIENRYRIIRILRGGMGKVYVAVDIALDQAVAIKTLSDRFPNDDQINDMFLSEAQIWILLEQHPNIVQAKSSFLVGGRPFLVVEYIDGGDLSWKLRQGGLDIRVALMLAIQFCAGAEYAYRKLRLVHRDIKPANLLLTSNGTLKITDFGLSRIGGALQARGSIAGTPLYMPPEQWMDADAVTKQSDIYSFGIVLYEMLTGRHPFQANTWEGLKKAHSEQPVPDPKTINPSIPDPLSAIVLKCLEKNPIRRFFHYEDLLDHLKSVFEIDGVRFAEDFDAKLDEKLYSPAELLNNGDSLFTIGKYQEALTYYDRLLELEPHAAKFWQRKAETLLRLKKYPEAELYFNKALSIEPSNLDAIKGNVRCLIHMDKQEDALMCCSPALALNPSDQDLLMLKQKLLENNINNSIEESLKGQQDQSTLEITKEPSTFT